MTRVWVSLGSNVEREGSIRGAVQALRRLYGELVVSPVYESDAVGFTGEPFYNLVVGFETEKPVEALCGDLTNLEAALGRVRGPDRFSPRTLDADLLLYGEQVVDAGRARLPREEILEYAFVLRPLAEVAGHQEHPILGRSFRELWAEFPQAEQPLRVVPICLD